MQRFDLLPWPKYAASILLALLVAVCTASGSKAQPPNQAAAPYVQSYRVLPKHEPIVNRLIEQFANENLFRQILDRPTSQWVVVAPAKIHEQIAKQLTASDGQAKPQATPKNFLKTDNEKFRLRSLNAQTLHARLEKVLGRRLPIQQDATGEWHGFHVDQQGGREVTIWTNRQTGEAQISGLPSQISSWRQVVEALDSPPSKKSATRVVATNPNTSVQVKQAVGVLQKPVLVAQRDRTKTDEQESEAPNNEDDSEQSLLGPVQIETVEGTDILVLRGNPSDVQRVMELLEEIEKLASDSVNELRIFKLQHALATELQKVLQSAFENSKTLTEGGNLSHLLRMMTIDAEGRRKLESGVLADAKVLASASTNALIVSAPPESMPLLAALIAQLDQTPDAIAELKVFTIANGDATSLAQMIQGLFGDPNQQQRRGPGGPGQSGLSGLRVEVDERTNSIIAAGTSDDLLVVEAVLLKLDADDARQRKNRVYRLNNAFADEVAISLQNWLEGVRNVERTAPGTGSPFQQIEREVVVVPDTGSNSLIVSASPQYYQEIEDIIRQLDEQAPMVMIQVLIAEIELGDTDEFGVELGLQDSVLFDRSLLENLETTTNTTITNDPGGGSTTFSEEIIQSATLTPGFGFGSGGTALGNAGSDTSIATAGRVAAQGLASFGVSRISPDAGFSGLVLSASSNSVSMLLRALQETRRVEVLSRPQIMAIDNQTGRAFVGETVPFITESTVNQFGNPINTIARIEVGLNLEVTPRISPDGLVVMKVFASNERLGNVADGVPIAIAPNGEPINSPIVETIQAETTVSALSGQTIVLSGLLTKQDRALHRRVPLLADLPLLGNLFRFDSVGTRRTELLIVLTPHVVKNQFEAEMLKQIESARIDWCLSDVIEMHGPVGLRSRRDPAGAAEAETIYPEQVSPQEFLPSLESYEPTP